MFMFEFIKWKPHLRAYCEGRPLVTSQKLQQTFPCHDGILWRPLRLYWQMHHLVGQNGHNFAFSKSLCMKIEHDRIFNNRVKCQCNTYHYNYIESGQCLAPKLEQPSCPHISLAPCYPMLSKGVSQGWVSSGRNLFLPGHPEKSGRNLFLPVLSGQNWKKLEKTMKEIRNTGKK